MISVSGDDNDDDDDDGYYDGDGYNRIRTKGSGGKLEKLANIGSVSIIKVLSILYLRRVIKQ